MADTLDIPQPRENHRLFGHETVEEALHEACNAERLHHSLLFAGPRGIGKATLAFRLARFLLKPESSGLLGLDVPAAVGENDEPDVSLPDILYHKNNRCLSLPCCVCSRVLIAIDPA